MRWKENMLQNACREEEEEKRTMKGALATNISHGVRHREVREPDGWLTASAILES